LKIAVCDLRDGSQKVFSPERDIFPEIASREYYRTPCFNELVMHFPCDESFRKSAQKINRALRRDEEDAIQYRTIANMIEREGEFIQEYLDKKAEKTLKSHGFTAEGKRVPNNKESSSENVDESRQEEEPSKGRENLDGEKASQNPETNHFDDNKEQDPEIERSRIREELICKAIEELNAGKEKELQIDLSELHETFEDPESVLANISIDDVMRKKTKRVK
jgi:hypothetical protein